MIMMKNVTKMTMTTMMTMLTVITCKAMVTCSRKDPVQTVRTLSAICATTPRSDTSESFLHGDDDDD